MRIRNWKKIDVYGWVMRDAVDDFTVHLWVGGNNNVYLSRFRMQHNSGSGERVGYLWGVLGSARTELASFTSAASAKRWAVDYMKLHPEG